MMSQQLSIMTQQGMIYTHEKSASFMSKFLDFTFKLIGLKKVLGRTLSDLENVKNDPAPPTNSVKKACNIQEESFGERTLWTLSPKNGTSEKAIFYIHGGGYVVNMAFLQWDYLAKVVEETQATIMVPDYPLAPQSNAEEAFEYLHKLYNIFLDRYAGKEVLILGDSAGAGLAISFAQYLNEVNLPQPEKLILLSPWLDVSLTNPDIQDVIPKDSSLEINSLQKAGRLWAGKLDIKDPKVSPIYGRFDNIAKISIFMGTAEIFVSDARKLVEKLQKENIPFHYYEYPDMPHCWILLPMPESKLALAQLMKEINE
ncbi:MAG: alpha/beta hydrolase [Bacteroidota bacterium]